MQAAACCALSVPSPVHRQLVEQPCIRHYDPFVSQGGPLAGRGARACTTALTFAQGSPGIGLVRPERGAKEGDTPKETAQNPRGHAYQGVDPNFPEQPAHHAEGCDEEDFNFTAPPEHVLRERAHFVESSAARLGQPPQRRDVGLRRRTVCRMCRLLHIALPLEVLQHARQAGLQRGSPRPLLPQPPRLHANFSLSKVQSSRLMPERKNEQRSGCMLSELGP
jgi:hypothetical protein